MTAVVWMLALLLVVISGTNLATAACVSDDFQKACSSHGTCENEVCTCSDGFIGNLCETADPCTSGSCGTNEVCSADTNDATQVNCTCHYKMGYGGDKCELAPTCKTDASCLNNGTCNMGKTPFACSCHKGFSGTLCQNGVMSVAVVSYCLLMSVMVILQLI